MNIVIPSLRGISGFRFGWILAVAVAGLATAIAGDTADIAIIPQPAKVQPGEGAFTLSPNTVVMRRRGSDEVARIVDRFLEQLNRATAWKLTSVESASVMPPKGAIVITTSGADKLLGPEGYSLTVTKDGIALNAPAPAGLFYGVQTMLQSLPAQVLAPGGSAAGVTWSVPAVTIEDQPRFGWRGMMLDASRHFQSKEYVKRYLDLMALHKLNTFHWHLTDDHGWRIEIKKYPKLTEVGAWRDQPGYPGGRYGGFYTQDDIREIVQYAKDRFITIVPEIEMPGHSAAAIAAYPELSCAGTNGKVHHFFDYPCKEQKFPPGGDNVFCAGNDKVFEFLQDVLTETMTLFPGTYIHIGGDEVDKKSWCDCPKCQERMKTTKLKDEHELQSWFIKRIEKFLNANNRRLIGWDEILEGGLAPNAAVMSWRGTQGGIAAAKAGHPAVMTPQNALYFDHYQSADPEHPPAWPGVNSLETVYRYEPVPDELSADQQKLILGTQANLWTCFTHTPELLDLMTFPRECALAEITWSPKDARNWTDFNRRLKTHLTRLDIMQVNSYRASGVVIGSWRPPHVSEQGQIFEYDVTPHITGPGQYKVTLNYTRGAHGLRLEWALLLENDNEIARDDHKGFTGWKKENITYTFDVKAVKPDAKYKIEIQIFSEGGTDSFGDVIWSRSPLPAKP